VNLAPSLTSVIEPGFRLDRYELLCPIAQGGMATVWLARVGGKFGFEKFVAVKMILPQFASDHHFEQMFLDEARLASRIEHPNVAQILDLGEHHDVLYLVMEWIEGDPLSRLYRATEKKGLRIPPGIVLRTIADACGGLHAAHEVRGADGSLLHVVHRDISPQNILVSHDGVAKLIDFGIAKARDRVAGETNAGVLKGKVRYMAPEQALGKKIDRRADVWAAAAVLYHLLSGKSPFQGDTEIATLRLLTSGEPPPPLPRTFHPALVEVLRRGLLVLPDERFATAAELQAAIESAAIEAGLVTTRATVASFVAEHMARRADRRKTLVSGALAAAAERRRAADVLIPIGADTGEISNAAAKIAQLGRLSSVPPPARSIRASDPHDTIPDTVREEELVTTTRAMPPRPEVAPSSPPSSPPPSFPPSFPPPVLPVSPALTVALFASGAALAFLVILVVLKVRSTSRVDTHASATQMRTPTAVTVMPPPPPPPVSPPKVAPEPQIPTLAATDLPKAPEAPAPRLPPPPPTPRPTATVTVSAAATSPALAPSPASAPASPPGPAGHPHRVDDGF
jgi:eukaryotic-like serine/threonine-protein kinase